MKPAVAALATATLLAALLPIAPAVAQGEGKTLSDPRGDVECCFFFPAPVFSNPDYLDLIAVGVAEERPDAVVFLFDVAGFGVMPEEVFARAGGAAYYYMDMDLGEDFWDPSFYVRVDASREAGGGVAWEASFSSRWCEEEEENSYRCDSESEDLDADSIEVDLESSAIRVTVPRELLLVGEEQRPLQPGDGIHRLWSYARQSFGVLLAASDDVSGDLDYDFQSAPGSELLKLSFLHPSMEDDPSLSPAARARLARGPVAVEPGVPKPVGLHLRQSADGTQMVALNASVVDESGVPIPGWQARVPAAVRLGSGETLSTSVFLSAAPDAGHGASGTLHLQGRIVGVPNSTAIAERPVVASVGLDVKANVLHLHSVADPQSEPFAEPIFGDAYQRRYARLSPLASLPLYDDGPMDLVQAYEAPLDAVLPNEVLLAADGTVSLSMSLRADREREVTLVADLSARPPAGAEVFLGDAEATVTASSSAQAVLLEFPVAASARILPEGSRLVLDLRGVEADGTPVLPGLRVDPAETTLTLPVESVKRPTLRATDGQHLPSLALSAGEDREAFTNPGGRLVFNLTLVNSGVVSDVIDVTLNGSRPGWRLDVLPGTAFALDPGRSVTFGVSATAPMGAKEEETLDFGVKAVSRGDPQALSELRLRVVTTSAVPLENETFQVSSEAVNATHLDGKRDAPGPNPLAALGSVVLAAIALGRSRRRGA